MRLSPSPTHPTINMSFGFWTPGSRSQHQTWVLMGIKQKAHAAARWTVEETATRCWYPEQGETPRWRMRLIVVLVASQTITPWVNRFSMRSVKGKVSMIGSARERHECSSPWVLSRLQWTRLGHSTVLDRILASVYIPRMWVFHIRSERHRQLKQQSVYRSPLWKVIGS